MDYETDGVPLGQYRQLRGVSVSLQCLDCLNVRYFDLEKVIARLEREGRGGADTGIKALAHMTKYPCFACGGLRFDSRPAFPRYSGMPARP